MRRSKRWSDPKIDIVAIAVAGIAFTNGVLTSQRSIAAPSSPPAPALSSDFPHLVPPPPSGLSPAEEQPWFDTFSWQEFIALNWPAVDGLRGVTKDPNDAAAFKAAFAPSDKGEYPQVVWGTWKQAYELFEQGSVRPTPWSSFSAVLPCVNPLTTTPRTYLDATDLDINQSFSHPLIDQKQKYTRYEIRLNEVEYDEIRGDDATPASWLYITSNLVLAQPINFSMSSGNLGVVEVKAAWKTMTAEDDLKRYYVVNALVLVDPRTKDAKYQKMGLVGFHIAHKTNPFKEWVWSTFEHVDNVAAISGITPSYNNGTAMPATPSGFDIKAPLFSGTFLPAPAPQQVTRVNPILTTPAMFSTADLNLAFQKLVTGTIWQNYQLVSTQWPTKPAQFKFPGTAAPNNGKYPDDCGVPFPSVGVANTVIETYDQAPTTKQIGNSCMSCHYLAAQSDFSWVLQLRNHDSVPTADQGQFLASERFVPDRAIRAISKLKPAEVERAAPMLRSLEAVSARQQESQ